MTDQGHDLPNGKRVGDEPAPLDDGEILEDPRRGGIPGDDAGRRVAAGGSGVFPASAGWPEGDMELRREGEWGQGDRGLAGYEDSGRSELTLGGDATDTGARALGRDDDLPGGGPTSGGTLGHPTPDEGAHRISRSEPSTAGEPGPADASTSELGLSTHHVAGEPGPSDEANAGLGIPPEGGD